MDRTKHLLRGGILAILFGWLCSIDTAVAQDPGSVDIRLQESTTTPGTLEVQVRANGQGFGDVVSNLTFSIRWATGTTAALGTRSGDCPGALPSPTAQVTNPNGPPCVPPSICSGAPTGFNYRTYNLVMLTLLDDEGCPWPQDAWTTVMRVPVTNNPGCTTFEISNDAWVSDPVINRKFFCSLGGIDKTGVIVSGQVQVGTCGSVDCLGVPGGAALPGTACNDNNACTAGDVWSAQCVCTGTPIAGPVMGAVTNNGPICAGQTLNLSASATGAGTITYAWSGPNVFSSAQQNPTISSATVAASGTYTVTASNGCGTNASGTTTATVNAAPSATISYAGSPYCSNAGTASVTLSGTTGGTYAGTSGLSINAATGAVNLGASTPGTYTVTYTVAAGGGCAQFQTTAGITITAVPNATISYAGSPYCSNAGTASVSRTGTTGGTYASAAGLSINSTTGAVNLGASTPGTYTVTYTVAAGGGCAQFQTTAGITITAAPNATISYAGSPYCSNAGTASVTRTGTSGGTYTASPAGLSIVASTGAVDLSLSTAGAYTVTYTIAASGGCAQFQATAGITITAAQAWYHDVDQDGFGDPDDVLLACSQPANYVSNNTDNCPTLFGRIGDACNDGNAGTINDVITANCVCAGTQPNDCLGVPGGPAQPGSSCNDNNACTTNDTWSATCVCVGTAVPGPTMGTVANNGPICAGQPLNLTATATGAGTITYAWSGPDGFSATQQAPTISAATVAASGTYTVTASNGCGTNATGTTTATVNTPASASISYTGSPYCGGAGSASVTRTGTGGGTYSASPAGLSIVAGTGSVDLSLSTPGTYTVTYTIAASGGCPQFQTTTGITITAPQTWYHDVDEDGFGDPGDVLLACSQPANYVTDNTDDCPTLFGRIGDACDDNDPNTSGDAITAQCVCAGTLADDCEGVPGGPAQPGTPCNDGDACTTNDVWSAQCACEGTLADADADGLCDANDNCPNLPGVQGDACNDNNPATTGDVITAQCVCAGTLADDCEGVPGGQAQPGTACDDGDACTVNDVYSANCVCEGTLADADADGLCDANDNCPNLPGVQGDACNDNNPATTGDVVTAQCVCAGTLVEDCEGVPGGPAQPGTACDDADLCTENDVYSANCVCAGTLADADADGICDAEDSCPDLPGEFGDPCDDGDPGTTGDLVNLDCICAGDPVTDCLGIPGGEALPGTACDDNDPCTTNDTWSATCTCEGTFADADNDGICDASDSCPNLTGEVGDACDDGNAGTTGDLINGNCQCTGVPSGCTEELTLAITLDGAGSEVTWVLYDETETLVVDQGGPYADGQAGTVVVEELCVATGCYHLVLLDAGGDGIDGGGYVLRDAQNRRLIDANGSFAATSSIGGAANRAFCVPTNNLGMIGNWCDRTNLALTSPVYCNSQPGASGYQFWIYDPHGSYNRRVLKPTNVLIPVQLNTNPVPANVDLNIRVRALVNGNYTGFGRTCRIRFRPLGSREMEEEVLVVEPVEDADMELVVFPNPNRGDLVFLNLDGVQQDVQVVTVDVYDSFGKRVLTTTLPVQDGSLFNHALPLSPDLAAGLYVLNITAGERSITERVIIQR